MSAFSKALTEIEKGETRICELEAEVKRLTELCAQLVGEETLHQDGEYETEMMKLRRIVRDANKRLRDIARMCSGEKTEAERYCRLDALDWHLCHDLSLEED